MDERESQRSPLAPVAELYAEICAAFSRQGAIGVLYVDCAALDDVEQKYGEDAHAGALAAVAELIGGACVDVLGRREPLARGEAGRGEVICFIAREPRDIDFHAKGLPALERVVRERLARNAQRVAYPYIRKLPPLPIGIAFVQRNPIVSPLSQVRLGMDEARDDARLNAQIARRSRRRDFLDVLIQGKLRSVYEPVVDATSLTVFGYEALVRGAEGGPFATPFELFGIAAEEGLLFELDCQCRRAAVEGAIDFPAGAKLFMNIRPTAIHDPSFQPDALTRTLERCGLGARATWCSRSPSRSRSRTTRSSARRATTTASSASSSRSTTPARATRVSRPCSSSRPSSSRSTARSCAASTRTPRARTCCARSRRSRST